MNILVLEDEEYRIATFQKALPKAQLARNVNEALELIAERKMWDVIFLDHDVPEDVANWKDSKSGYDFLVSLIESNVETDLLIIHSLNPVGVMAMTALGRKYYKTYVARFGSREFLEIIEQLLSFKHILGS